MDCTCDVCTGSYDGLAETDPLSPWLEELAYAEFCERFHAGANLDYETAEDLQDGAGGEAFTFPDEA